MKKMFLITLTAAGLLGACATDAGLVDQNLFANGNAGVFDSNRNGFFERTEYDAFGVNNFGVWDTNDDNWIDENEFGLGWDAAGWDNDVGAFDMFDDDDNRYLAGDEFFGDDEFGVWDRDVDGILENDEFGI